MSRKKTIDLEQTKQSLLEEGLELIERKGFNATGIQEITDKAGVPKGSFYNYFASKEDFGVELIRFYARTRLSQWKEMLGEESEDGCYLKLMAVFVEMAARYEAAQPKKGCLLGNLAGEISEVSEDCRNALGEAMNEFKGVLAQRIRAGQQMGKVRGDILADRLADLVWDAWQGSLLRMKAEKSVEPVKNTLEMLFHNMLLPAKN